MFKDVVENIIEDVVEVFIFYVKFIFYSLLIILAFVLILALVFFVLTAGYIQIGTNPKRARPLYIILLGSPESSKEITGLALSKKYKIPYLSMQEMLNQNNNAEYSTISKDILIEKNITENLLSKNAENGLILSGYPYDVNQTENLDRLIGTTVQKRAFIVIVSAVKTYTDDSTKQRQSKTDLILDNRCNNCILDPVSEKFRYHRGVIYIDSNKLTAEKYNTLFKAINKELSGLLFK